MSELMEAVDALTLPVISRVRQEPTEEGGKAYTAIVVQDPLLTQLEQAISSTIGAGGGRTMTAKWALNVLDSDALYSFTVIDSTVRDWCKMVGLPRPAHPNDGLRAWFENRKDAEEAVDAWHTNVLNGWAATIRTKLNPVRTVELTFACPACGSDTWTDADGGVFKHPLRMTYLPEDPDLLNTARAVCKACAEVWQGVTTLRGLRWEADVAESA